MKKKHGKKSTVNKAFYFMVVPFMILFFIFHTIPFLQGIFYSFTDWKGYGIWNTVGFRNYIQFFKDPAMGQTYAFTIKFALCATILVNVLSLALACGLNAKIKFKNTIKAIYFLPYMLGILFVTVWQAMAFNTLIYLSGLQTVDRDVYEAADLDGATGFKRFTKITFPLIAPFFTINMVLSVKNFLMAFDQIMAMTGGGPGTSTTSISVLIYKRGFDGGQFAYQSANAVILFLIIAGISIFQLKVLEKREAKMN